MDELSIKMIMILFPGIITTMLLDKIIEQRNTQSSVPLTQQIAEGFNLKVSNKAPSPRPTTPPVNQKK